MAYLDKRGLERFASGLKQKISDVTGYIAPDFASGSHRKGELCFRLGLLYRCNATHTASGSMSWREQFWDEVSVSDVVRGLQSDVDGLEWRKADVDALILTNKKLKYLAELTKGQAWDTEAGTTPAYQHTFPSGAKAVAVNAIGGKTVVFNQLVQNGNFTSTSGWSTDWDDNIASGSITASDNICTFTAAQSGTHRYSNEIHRYLPRGVHFANKIFVSYRIKSSVPTKTRVDLFEINSPFMSIKNSSFFDIPENTWTDVDAILANSQYERDGQALMICLQSDGQVLSAGDTVQISDVVCVDLTQMFGAGNEPSTAQQVKAILTGGYYNYSTGALISANVTSVDSKDANSVSLGSLAIPQALRTAYPLHSAGTVYDEYDIESKKFIQRVGSYTFTGGENVDTIDVLGTNEVVRAWVSANVPDMSGVVGSWKNVISNKLETSTSYNAVMPYTIAHAYSGGEATYPKSFIIKLPYSVGTTAAEIKAWITANTPTVFFALNTPVETDISSYFGDDNLLTVEAGGTLTFTQDNTQTSNLPVPNDTEYAINLEEATE